MILDLARRMYVNFHDVSTSIGLTPPEGLALHRLDEPLPMGTMADLLGCDASYITVLVDRLEPAQRPELLRLLRALAPDQNTTHRLTMARSRDPLRIRWYLPVRLRAPRRPGNIPWLRAIARAA